MALHTLVSRASCRQPYAVVRIGANCGINLHDTMEHDSEAFSEEMSGFVQTGVGHVAE